MSIRRSVCLCVFCVCFVCGVCMCVWCVYVFVFCVCVFVLCVCVFVLCMCVCVVCVYVYGVCVYVCVCSLRYPACIAHAPCGRLWPPPFLNISRYLINGTIFEGKKLLTQNVCFEFLYNVCVKCFSV
jgi:hypothetical protein